ncbi:MAG: uracil-DNA glycosylase [Solirubrobacterales bacterium]|nr:uracil-DNA glycosylase [Solirubrobacterales bacterium]MCO5328381.1 uracil-DNA glycosylase [Solirubrobacterales bacterium]
MSDDASARRERLVEVYREASTCTLCPLAETRTKVVFGAGNADADLMFVGEAPGADEDRQGLPFVGRAGQLLNDLLAGIGLRREDVFIANTLLCRPPGNRDPQPIELETCRPYLHAKIELIEPKVIATLGNFATKLITNNQTGITRVHGKPQTHTLGERTVRVFPIFHPAAILRNPNQRPMMDADFAALRTLLDEPPPAQPQPQPQDAGAPAGPVLSGSPPAAAPAEDQLDIFGGG